MPLNLGRETPRDFNDRLERDAEALYRLVFSPREDNLEFVTDEDRNFAETLADDFIDRGDSSLRPRQYIQQIYELATVGKGV